LTEEKKIRILITTEALLLLIAPVTLFTFRILPPMWRYGIMEAALLVLFILIIKRKTSARVLGLRKDNFLSGIKVFMPGTIMITAGLLLTFFLKGGNELWWDTKFFLYYWLVGVFSQQFAFQGYLSRRLRHVTEKKWFVVIIIGLMFSFLHSYRLQPEISAATFFLGMYWAWTYIKVPNLYAVSLSHGIIGTVSILLGFV
jgi:membrane protease YdiL (CAAX protease family)